MKKASTFTKTMMTISSDWDSKTLATAQQAFYEDCKKEPI